MHEPVDLPIMPLGREREIFVVLLSSPLVGANEALALLGTCKEARSVGRAASLDAVRAVSTFYDEDDVHAPHVQMYGLQSRQHHSGREEWFLESAVSVAKGASARFICANELSFRLCREGRLGEVYLRQRTKFRRE